jgi:hypothetical protein
MTDYTGQDRRDPTNARLRKMIDELRATVVVLEERVRLRDERIEWLQSRQNHPSQPLAFDHPAFSRVRFEFTKEEDL